MEKKKYKKETNQITEEVLVSSAVYCNYCASKTTVKDNYFQDDKTEVTISFGYGSKYDMLNLKYHICDSCVLKEMKKMKYPPTSFFSLLPGGDLIEKHFTQNQKNKVFRNWKKTNKLKYDKYITLEILKSEIVFMPKAVLEKVQSRLELTNEEIEEMKAPF